ncbi:DUF2867 domain-containing protein [Mycobacterium sp. 3519A]|jgi:hypothetical protein|uniref:DUF2867 domain-containing protein n=1 Tax=Mycobacterium sp. 3519A TaxID=2057184 RepID=UPI001156CF49|nr:DUF2867 domain-containing protein [Mycobacterium sp. 3519A]
MTTDVRQIDVPPTVLALSTLPRIDYSDAFVFDHSGDDSPEDLMRGVLEGAPPAVRAQLLSGWSAIGLKVAGGSDGSVLGWQVRRSTPEHVLLGADSRIGMPGELLLKKDDGALIFSTLVAQRNLLARAVWAVTEPVHVRVVRDLLAQAAQRLRA